MSSGIARVGQAGAEEMSTEIKSTYVNSKSKIETSNMILSVETSNSESIVGGTSNLLLQSKTVNDSIKQINTQLIEESVINDEIETSTSE